MKKKFTYKKKIYNQSFFSTNPKNLNTVFYGLPKNIQYCKGCLINNQKPTMRSEHAIKKGDKNRTVIFENGTCEACRVNEEKKKN